MESRTYIAIDLKSFYASVECADRHIDPLDTHLVVADASRTDKTICLAVSPSLKSHGVPGRPRLFEVVQKVREINRQRLGQAPGGRFSGASCSALELERNPALKLDYIVATPRMARYLEISSRIYGIYLNYLPPNDIHVYSIDEVFIDATNYMRRVHTSAHAFAMRLIHDVLATTGITATAGIGSNLYLCKIAMDIVAKHQLPDKDGVRIAELTERTYREQLWNHRPLTDFWRIGHGTAARLAEYGIFTMGDVARMSEANDELLYRLFGVNAELLIDHAWGWEPCTMPAIKAYRPSSSSISTGQVLQSAYDFERGRLVVREMADKLAMDLVAKHLVTDHLMLVIGYDAKSLTTAAAEGYRGPVGLDFYGRPTPKSARGTISLGRQTSSSRLIMQAVASLFDRIVNRQLLVRRLYVTAEKIAPESALAAPSPPVQLDLFTDYRALERQKALEDAALAREKRQQLAVISIRNRLGKNAILKGLNLEEGATARERNLQIGGHKA